MKKPRITLIARADNTGLGNQTWELSRHLKPHKTYVIDLTQINNTIGKKTELHMDRYPDARLIEGFPDYSICKDILDDTDVLFTVEIPYNYGLFELAKDYNVKTILQYNYEFLDYLQQSGLPWPDVLLAPSQWNLSSVTAMTNHASQHYGIHTSVKYLPVPTNREVLPFKQRTKANHFLHIAGHPTFMDRNGTLAVLGAWLKTKSKDIKLTIYSQYPIDALQDPRITVKNLDIENYWEIYQEKYDVLLLPRRYGGLSLQLNEALSVGMPVLMTDVEPQNNFLPQIMRVGIDGHDVIQTRAQIKCYKPDIDKLAMTIDLLHAEPSAVKAASEWADVYSLENSWDHLLPRYQQLINELCPVANS